MGERENPLVEINEQKTKDLIKDQSIKAESCLFGKTNKIKKCLEREKVTIALAMKKIQRYGIG